MLCLVFVVCCVLDRLAACSCISAVSSCLHVFIYVLLIASFCGLFSFCVFKDFQLILWHRCILWCDVIRNGCLRPGWSLLTSMTCHCQMPCSTDSFIQRMKIVKSVPVNEVYSNLNLRCKMIFGVYQSRAMLMVLCWQSVPLFDHG